MDRNDVRNQWDNVSKTYSESRDPDGPETQLISNLLERLDAEPRVLDIGCGDGRRTLQNLPTQSVGVDISRDGLQIADQNVRNELLQADMVSLPFADNSFDAITAYFAVFHVGRENHETVYNEFARVLRPDGELLMTLPGGNFETVRRGWMGGKMLFSSPGKRETFRLLEQQGFEQINTKVSNDPLGGSTEFATATYTTNGE